LSDPYPRYPNPTIVEVTCEIAFSRRSANPLTSRSLYSVFGDDFPELQPFSGNIQIIFAPPGVMPPPVQAHQQATSGGFRSGNADNNEFVQVTSASFVYQLMGAKYAGWSILKEKVLSNWQKVFDIATPEKIAKIGLRYVNRIPKELEHPRLSSWLATSNELPSSLIESQGHFFARIESSPATGHLKIVTLANQDLAADLPCGAIILDIDRICMESEIGMDELSSKLDQLHSDIWTTFDSARTELLLSRLKAK